MIYIPSYRQTGKPRQTDRQTFGQSRKGAVITCEFSEFSWSKSKDP